MAGKLCVSITNAKNDADRATVGFVVANAAVGSSQETMVFLSTEAVRLAVKGYADDIHEEGFAPLRDLLANFVKGGGRSSSAPPASRREASTRSRWSTARPSWAEPRWSSSSRPALPASPTRDPPVASDDRKVLTPSASFDGGNARLRERPAPAHPPAHRSASRGATPRDRLVRGVGLRGSAGLVPDDRQRTGLGGPRGGEVHVPRREGEVRRRVSRRPPRRRLHVPGCRAGRSFRYGSPIPFPLRRPPWPFPRFR